MSLKIDGRQQRMLLPPQSNSVNLQHPMTIILLPRAHLEPLVMKTGAALLFFACFFLILYLLILKLDLVALRCQ